MGVDLRKVRFGNFIRTTESHLGQFDSVLAPSNFQLENVVRAEGPFKALRNGKLTEVALLKYQVNKLIIADVWVDLSSISSEQIEANESASDTQQSLGA